MTRQRKNSISPSAPLPPALAMWAEAIGDAIGRGVMKALHNGGLSSVPGAQLAATRRRGRPPKMVAGGPIPADRICTVPGCGRESRSKGLCSAHYQAERRRQLAARGS
jgi:hypothetical protein